MTATRRPSTVAGLRRGVGTASPPERTATAAELADEHAHFAAARAAAPAPTAPRSKPVRMTIEITPQMHRQLTAWTHELMLDLDLTRITMSDAVRAMITLTATDPEVSAKVRDLVQQAQQ